MTTTETTTDSQAITPKPAEMTYTFETLPKLLPQQQLMLRYILEGDNYTEAYRKAGYSSEEHAGKASWFLVSRNPLKAHLEYFRSELARLCTTDYMVSKLAQIADIALSNPQYIDSATKALDVMAKIQGKYNDKSQMNIQINTSVEDIRRAKSEYIKDK